MSSSARLDAHGTVPSPEAPAAAAAAATTLLLPPTAWAYEQVGLQEKATFLQAFGKKGVYSGFLRLPAAIELCLLVLALLVLYHYSAAAAGPKRPALAYAPVHTDEEGGGAAAQQ